MEKKKIHAHAAILGGGSFGTALAIHLDENVQVKVWEFYPTRSRSCKRQGSALFCLMLRSPKRS